MRIRLTGIIVSALLLGAQAGPASAISPNAGAVEGKGTVKDSDGRPGSWSVKAVLKDGSFSGEVTLKLGDHNFTAPLLPRQSFLENGRCYFSFDKDRARATLGGPCTTDSIKGTLDGFLPGLGSVTGSMDGTLSFGKAGAAKAPAAVLPTGKLTCAWWETRVTFNAGEINSRELKFSKMGTLTLSADGTYRTATGSGKFVKEGNRIRLTSGAYSGAIGQLRNDTSGQPAVYFERYENKRANGVHIIDPATTACTKARS